MLFIFVLLILYLRYLYSLFFIEGKIKIPYNDYQIRRIKYFTYDNDIEELKKIAINSVGIIPKNPIFYNKNLDNKIVLIIYKNNEPIGLNIMFDYKFNNSKCLHTGLVLIDKKYQGNKLQYFAKINIILYIIENIFSNIYISDIGNSASGLRIFNKNIKNSYPNLIYNTKPDKFMIKLGNHICNNLKDEIRFSPESFDQDKFIIRKARNTDDLKYLVDDNCVALLSSDEKYNEYIKNNLDKLDDYLCIGKINLFNVFF